MKRVFLGIDLPDDLKFKIENLKLGYQLKQLPIKLVEKENSHIAVKFLDELDEQQIEVLNQTIEREVIGFKSFEVKIENVLAFPDFFRPKVLALKVISANLEGLAKKLFTSFQNLDFILAEDKKYTPHITLGRIKAKLSKPELEKVASIKFEDKFTVDAIHLFESQLTSEGPVYSILKTFELK